MNQWWSNLNTRERLILIAASLLVSVLLIDSFVVEEIRIKNQALNEQIEQARDDLEWMQQAVYRLPQQKQAATKVISGRVVTFVDQQITRMGLKQQMQQMTPLQDHSVRVKLADVEFDKLLRFFNAIDGAILIEEVRLIPSDQKGLVNVSLVLSNGSGPA